MSSEIVTTLQQWSSSRSPPDASPDAFSSSLTTTVFSQRSMRRLEASPPQGGSEGPSILHLSNSTASRKLTCLHGGLLSAFVARSEEHTSELRSLTNLVC